MGFFIELILEYIGDVGIGLVRMDKRKRKELFAEAKAYFREKLAQWKKK